MVLAALISPVMTYFSFRTIINWGLVVIGFSLIGIAVMAIEDLENPLVYTMLIFLALYQLTLGPYTWVYLGAVCSDAALSISVFMTNVPIFPASMFTKMGAPATFFFFGGTTLCFAVFLMLFLRETKGLSRKEAQFVYSRSKTSEEEVATQTVLDETA